MVYLPVQSSGAVKVISVTHSVLCPLEPSSSDRWWTSSCLPPLPSDVGQIWGGEVSGLHDFIYIFIFSGKFAVLPTHGLAGDKLLPAGSPGDPLHPGGVRAVHRGPGVHACGNGAGESIGQL